MPGVKGKSGGARRGAGRKPEPSVPSDDADPLSFLRKVWMGQLDASPAQVRAASAALPFVHGRIGEGGKKDQRNEEAKKVASRFAVGVPPRLAAAGGKKI